MSTYVLMRIFESAPSRYDLGIRLLTFGGAGRAYDRLARRIEPGWRVLDVGCGTGALALRAAARGATVRGIDADPRMLEIAERRAREAGLGQGGAAGAFEPVQMGVAELDGEEAEGYDAVTIGLCLSELSDDELTYTLKEVRRILKPGGLFLVADEVRPTGLLKSAVNGLVRIPLAALTFIITQQTTRPVRGLPGRLADAGFSVTSLRASALGSFAEIIAQKAAGESP